MKKYLLLVIVPLLIGVVTIPSTPSQAQSETEPIIIGTLDLPARLDPAAAGSFMEWEILSHLYTGLTRQTPGTTDYELAAATSHIIAADGLTHTFNLRDDLTFTDGTRITAETFANSIQRVLFIDEGGASIMRDVVESVEATAETTLLFRLQAPVAYFEALVSLPPFFAVHPDDFPDRDIIPETTALNGNGLYTLTSFQNRTQVELAPNPDYQFGDGPRNAGITLRRYEASVDLSDALEVAAIDIAWRDVLVTDAVNLAESNASIQIEQVPSVRMWYFVLNLNENFSPENEDVVRREVILKTMNPATVVDEYFGDNAIATGSIVPEFTGDAFSPIFQSYEDPEEGATIFEEEGRSPNRPIGLVLASSRTSYGDYYTTALNRLRVSLRPINNYVNVVVNANFIANTWVQGLQTGTYQSAIFAWTPVVPHPDAYLRPLLHSENALPERYGYAQTEIDVLLNEARRTVDPAAQAEVYREIQQAVLDSYSLIPLWQTTVHVLYRDNISGVTLEPNFFLHYDLLEK